MNKHIIIIIFLHIIYLLQSTPINSEQQLNSHTFIKESIIPIGLLTFGILGIENDIVKSNNSDIKEEVTEHIDEKFTIDDFAQYAPIASVYFLNYAGIKGKNNIITSTKLLASSYLIMGTTVLF